MKGIDGYDKLRGGYYTPSDISDFIVSWAVRSSKESILEPSCGDGSFLAAIQKNHTKLGYDEISDTVIGIELDSFEAAKARQYGYTIINEDYFTFYEREIEGKRKYDVIVGNPPFIRYQNFDEQYRKVAFELMKGHGFHPNRLTNIWLPFLLLSSESLSENGRIGMVIPAELFQVDYAAEARKYLSSHFDKLILVTFKKLVFEEIQQEVVLLLGEKSSKQKGIQVVELESLEELVCNGLSCLKKAETKKLDHNTDKWVKYYLSNEELEVLGKLNNDTRISNATELFEVNVGLVSGENDFFLLNWDDVVERKLEADVSCIVSRAEQVKGILFTEKEYLQLKQKGKRVSIFMPGDKPLDELRESARSYIAWGESKGYNKNYKCRIRKRWYYVPKSWKADAFLIRQANLYPKMIMNSVGALVTDTLHKVRFHDGVEGYSVVSAFLNTYTLALGETLGRSYGGGVLTFEPGEMRKMRIPMRGADQLDIQKIDRLQREGKYEDILAYTDQLLLYDNLHLTEREVSLLHSIWNKLRNRRLMRKQSN